MFRFDYRRIAQIWYLVTSRTDYSEPAVFLLAECQELNSAPPPHPLLRRPLPLHKVLLFHLCSLINPSVFSCHIPRSTIVWTPANETTRQQDGEGIPDSSLIRVCDVLSEIKHPLRRCESIQADSRDRSEICAYQPSSEGTWCGTDTPTEYSEAPTLGELLNPTSGLLKETNRPPCQNSESGGRARNESVETFLEYHVRPP